MIMVFLASMILILLGVHQYKSQKPVSLSTGEKPPKEDELTDMTEWNHRHGRNLIIYACVTFTVSFINIFFIGYSKSVLPMLIAYFGGFLWVEIEHKKMKRTLIKK